MKKIVFSLMMSSLVLCAYAQEDNQECLSKSLKIFTPFEGFFLTDYCNYAEFGSYEFPVDRGARAIKKEGVYREVWFHKKEESNRQVSGLQILQNYMNAIRAAGGKVLKESDGNVFTTTYQEKELWIFVNANTNSMDLDNYGISSIEVDVMKQEISAKDIEGSMATQGKIALYGIHFDIGKSEILPESEEAIHSVATYLTENPVVKVYIVGHTDNTGDYMMNQKLSKSRAESVKNYLISKYIISSSRLTSEGVGPACPLTTNETEEGKSLNRRVEIVKN